MHVALFPHFLPSRMTQLPASQQLRIGLPSGSLQSPTIELFAKAGYVVSGADRSYKPHIDDPQLEVRLLRAQEMSRYVEQGFLDAGITGRDWIAENNSQVAVLTDLPYSRASSAPTRWVVVVPENSPIQSIEQLAHKRIATEAIALTKRYFEAKNVPVHVEFSWGATEVKVPDLVDAIVDITETGSSLRANKLRILATIMESYPQLIANHDALRDPWKSEKLHHISLLLTGALAARDKVGLKMNIQRSGLDALLAELPALRNPTIAPLATEGWVAVETVIDERIVREIIPALKTRGAEGIIEYPLNKVVY